MIRLSRKDLQNLETGLNHEWLETNGLGGYASSTVLGINTRRYHGLLVAALKPPVERVLLVSRLDEAVIIGDTRLEISSSEYQDAISPEGYRYLEEVRIDPYPVFTYVVGGIRIDKSVFMVYGENTTCVAYTLYRLPNGPRRSQVILEVRPLVAFRDHHSLMTENEALLESYHAEPGHLKMRPYVSMPALGVSFHGGRFEQSGYWYRNYRYRKEEADGYQHREDLFSPGRLVFSFESADTAGIAFSTKLEPIGDIVQIRNEELERRVRLSETCHVHGDFAKQLVLAADAFVVRRQTEGRTVIAGYPWFTDWGRDTMISLPGLTLATGRFEDARSIINEFVSHMRRGLVPNRFPDSAGDAEYNTIDATLWLFEAVRKYYDCTGDLGLIQAVLPSLRDAVKHHLDGTMFAIKADDDGLLAGGAQGVQLTWMDAKVGDEVVTPRGGKPVEINALWYNALRIMADFCSDVGALAEESKYDYLAGKVFHSFNMTFWNPENTCLFDCVRSDYKDASVRPNQIFAMSLTYPVLEYSKWKSVLDVVGRELLTPYGLRTLSPLDPRYRGRYEGDLRTRDHAYHQGTVWPWLLGHYIRAYLRLNRRSPASIAYCLSLLEPFKVHLGVAGLGSISEIFDGDPPHLPRGCIAQAWSVAEILRTLAEDLLEVTIPPSAVGRKNT